MLDIDEGDPAALMPTPPENSGLFSRSLYDHIIGAKVSQNL